MFRATNFTQTPKKTTMNLASCRCYTVFYIDNTKKKWFLLSGVYAGIIFLESFKRLYCTCFPCLPVPSKKKFRTRLLQGISRRQSQTEIDQKTLATPKPTPKRLLPSHRLHNRLRGVGKLEDRREILGKKKHSMNDT